MSAERNDIYLHYFCISLFMNFDILNIEFCIFCNQLLWFFKCLEEDTDWNSFTSVVFFWRVGNLNDLSFC